MKSLAAVLCAVAITGNIYLEMGGWASFGLFSVFMYCQYLDHQYKVLRHQLNVATQDGKINASVSASKV